MREIQGTGIREQGLVNCCNLSPVTCHLYSKGFVMVEVMLASVIAAVVGIVLVVILTNNTGTYYQQNAVVTGNLSLNDMTSEIGTLIKGASAVVTGYPADSPIYFTSDQVLVLKIPAVNDGAVVSGAYDYAAIYKDSQQSKILYLQIFPDSQSSRQAQTKVLTTLLDSVKFEYLDKSGVITTSISAVSVKVTATVGYQNGSIIKKTTSNIVVGLRNSTL